MQIKLLPVQHDAVGKRAHRMQNKAAIPNAQLPLHGLSLHKELVNQVKEGRGAARREDGQPPVPCLALYVLYLIATPSFCQEDRESAATGGQSRRSF